MFSFTIGAGNLQRVLTAVAFEAWLDLKELKDYFDIAARPEEGHFARRRVRSFAVAMGFSGTGLDDLELAAGEAITNAVLYGSPKPSSRIAICLDYDDLSHQISIEIHDQGKGFDPEKTKPSCSPESTGGRGLKLMRLLMDHVQIHQEDDGMIVCLVKSLL